jgi:hypothetical protein
MWRQTLPILLDDKFGTFAKTIHQIFQCMYKETHITDFRVTKFREKRQQDALQRLENKVFIVGNNI